MDQKENEKSLVFTKEDFFNVYEMKNFVHHLSRVEDVDTYMKKAIINRVMIDTQSEEQPLYEKLMGYIQSKGIEQVLQSIEKREEPPALDEQEVEQIVLRVLKERQVTNVSVIREEVDTQVAKTQEPSLTDRKKASSKLKNL